MKWRFSSYPLDLVEIDVTQRDQFRNDDVDLADSLGRESTQNSLDATIQGNGGVRVRFSFLRGDNAPNQDYLKNLFEGYREHAQAAGINLSVVDFGNPTALVVEDFGTRGLTGRMDIKDTDNFSDFWRRHGLTHKSGKSLGRWGLGKLVFPMSSQLSAFFGLTVQSDTGQRALMGQTVLGMHTLNNEDYPPHAFFAEMQLATEGKKSLPLPITDEVFLNEFSKQFRLTRANEPGLSVVIPFPNQELDRERMIVVAISNYFIPIPPSSTPSRRTRASGRGSPCSTLPTCARPTYPGVGNPQRRTTTFSVTATRTSTATRFGLPTCWSGSTARQFVSY